MTSYNLAFINNLSSWEIILIFLVVLLFFGAKRLPGLFKSVGKSVKEFKKATTEIEEEVRSAMDTTDSDESAPNPTPASASADSDTEHSNNEDSNNEDSSNEAKPKID
jgi:sec-independent protein translocase protein TatA